MRIHANCNQSRDTELTRAACIVILVLDRAQMLDVAGPADAFAMASNLDDARKYDVSCVSKHGGPVILSNGLSILTQAIKDIKQSLIDTLIVAGADEQSLIAAMKDEELKAWVLKTAQRARRVASVCVGSFLLAQWGLLDLKRATSHWSAVDLFQRSYPNVKVDRTAIYVQDGKFWTAGGVTTGIDLTLALIEADSSRRVAGQVASMLVMAHRRSGNQAQYSTELNAQSGRYAALIDWMRVNLKNSLSIASLASHVNETERTFCRRFSREVGRAPAQFVEDLRLAGAKRAMQGGASIKLAAKNAGFTSQEHLSRVFRKRFEMTPQAYREAYSSRREDG